MFLQKTFDKCNYVSYDTTRNRVESFDSPLSQAETQCVWCV